jgi:hypothetical protein
MLNLFLTILLPSSGRGKDQYKPQARQIKPIFMRTSSIDEFNLFI